VLFTRKIFESFGALLAMLVARGCSACFNSHQRPNSHNLGLRGCEICRANNEIWWLYWWLFVSNFCAFSCHAPQRHYELYVAESKFVMRFNAIHCKWMQNRTNGTYNPPGFGPYGFDPFSWPEQTHGHCLRRENGSENEICSNVNPQVLRQHFAAAVPKESLNSGKSREEAQE
jgi:hypothetical protein